MAIVTVCVLTYNPDWIKFRNTLKSIICQKGVDFDVVISDDGSKDNCFDKAEEYLQGNNFSAYCFIANKQNQGTVKNAISALQHTESKYVKLISPGDFLYDENVLAKFTDFAEKNPAAAYFGNAVYYSANENGEIKIYESLHNPKDLKPWIEQDEKKIRKNYILRQDYILGACFFCNQNILLDYVKKISNVVKYAEDVSLVWQVADKQNIMYINTPFIFYEYGFGISTSSSNKWSSILKIDNLNGFELMYKNKSISFLELQAFKSRNRLVRLVSKLLLDPLCLLNKFREKENSIIINVEESKEKINLILK
jgi:glycosyltransferase involved in cell wall biosynthesis